MNRELELPNIWDNPERAQQLGKEKARLEAVVLEIARLSAKLADADQLLEMAVSEQDQSVIDGIQADVAAMQQSVSMLEFKRMFHGEMDGNNAFVDVQSGAGGTEAQDWAQMLLRMYLRWADQHDFTCEMIEESPGDVAGIKSATFRVVGDHDDTAPTL